MSGKQIAASSSVERILEERRRSLDAGTGTFPQFVYSFSSRGFPDLMARYGVARDLTPAHLVSLFDLHYYLGDPAVDQPTGASQIRFVDSGGYEILAEIDPLDLQGEPRIRPWTPELYVAAARTRVRDGDTLVSFDDPALTVSEQINLGLNLFEEVGTRALRRDLLIHPGELEASELARLVSERAADFDILGVTEKDIGGPWFLAASYLRELRTTLDKLVDRYLPIHVFGCLDPRTLPYMFFAGGDIFDGLAWMRYYFSDGRAYYAREMEYDRPAEAVLDPLQATIALLAHNVNELERLRNDLQFSVLSADSNAFRTCLEDLWALTQSAPLPDDSGGRGGD